MHCFGRLLGACFLRSRVDSLRSAALVLLAVTIQWRSTRKMVPPPYLPHRPVVPYSEVPTTVKPA